MIQLGSGEPEIPPINRSISPSEDFYSHINKKWLKKTKLPPYDGSYSVSEEIEDNVRDILLKAIDMQRKENPDDHISNLATSFLQYSHQLKGVVALNNLLSKFNCMRTKEDIGIAIGELNRIQAKSPLSLIVSGDSYETSKCCIYIYEVSIGLPSKHYYYTRSMKFGTNNVLEQYKKFLKQVGDLLLQPSLESLVMIERAILPCLSTSDERNNISFTNNPYSIEELKKKYKIIPWDAIFKGWGLSDSIARKTQFVLTNKRYFEGLEKMFKVFEMEAWRTWLRGLAILSFIEYLPPPFDDLHFNLFGKLLKGNNEKLPQKYLMLKVLQKFSPQDLGKIFVKHAVPKDTKQITTQMVKNLKNATIKRLERVTWLEEKTKIKAIQKVENMKFQVAYPEKWESETKDNIILKDQPLQNILQLNIHDTNMMLAELKSGNCEKDEGKWEDGCFEVNAYYYSEGNMMVIPAGILRAPFFDITKSDAWNLGGIGSAIGHEITHGFDIDGRMYDAKGNYNNWWTKKDERQYTKLTKKVVDLFDGIEYMKGKIDGELTLSENLADIGGLAISLEALNKILKEGNKNETERKKAYKEFFTSYAISWRNKDRPQKARDSLFTDSHAPAQFRVNKIVHQFPEFYTAFDIKKEDKGWIDPDDRVVLW